MKLINVLLTNILSMAAPLMAATELPLDVLADKATLEQASYPTDFEQKSLVQIHKLLLQRKASQKAKSSSSLIDDLLGVKQKSVASSPIDAGLLIKKYGSSSMLSDSSFAQELVLEVQKQKLTKTGSTLDFSKICELSYFLAQQPSQELGAILGMGLLEDCFNMGSSLKKLPDQKATKLVQEVIGKIDLSKISLEDAARADSFVFAAQLLNEPKPLSKGQIDEYALKVKETLQKAHKLAETRLLELQAQQKKVLSEPK